MPDAVPSAPEPYRVSDEDLADLASTLARTLAEVEQHGRLLDRLGVAEPDAASASQRPAPGHPGAGEPPVGGGDGPTSVFILALGGAAYARELAALSDWVNHLLLPVYGREITTPRPWCDRWHEHPEAVARLHGLWLAWQQLTDVQAGLGGPSIWHRDHLDQAMAQLRAPDGPFAACTTSPGRPHHRVLATPAPEVAGASR